MITSEQLASLGKRRQSAINRPMVPPSGCLVRCSPLGRSESRRRGVTPATRIAPSGRQGEGRLGGLASPSDTKSLIETAVRRFLAEVPALQPLKLVAGLELRGRGDVQMYRVELPGPKVSKDMSAPFSASLISSRDSAAAP